MLKRLWLVFTVVWVPIVYMARPAEPLPSWPMEAFKLAFEPPAILAGIYLAGKFIKNGLRG